MHILFTCPYIYIIYISKPLLTCFLHFLKALESIQTAEIAQQFEIIIIRNARSECVVCFVTLQLLFGPHMFSPEMLQFSYNSICTQIVCYICKSVCIYIIHTYTYEHEIAVVLYENAFC